MAYPDGVDSGQCPYTHPHHLVSIFFEVWFDVWPFRASNGRFVLANGDLTGYGLHADFLNGWDSGVLSRAIQVCTSGSGVLEDCPVFKNEGRILADADMNSCAAPNPMSSENVVAPMLPYLPGCVAPTSGPGPASPSDLVPGCQAAVSRRSPDADVTLNESAARRAAVPEANMRRQRRHRAMRGHLFI